MKKKDTKPKIEIRNKKASFDYKLSDEIVAGISLLGSEAKSIRLGKADIKNSFCIITDGEMFITGMHVSEYKQAGFSNHEPYRKRKLLLTKKQIRKFEKELAVKGNTIVPVKLFINEKRKIKIVVAVATGKKKFEKRNKILQKQIDREIKEKINSLK